MRMWFLRARRATSLLWANRVLLARAACHLETGGSGFCARAPRDIPVMGEPAESQPISQVVQQAVNQTISRTTRQAHSLDFFSGRLGYKQRGEQQLSEQAMVEW